jgi:hypothetical protein
MIACGVLSIGERNESGGRRMSAFKYIHHTNGIHEYVTLEATQAATDAWLKAMRAANAQRHPGVPMLSLINVSHAMPPMGYTVQEVQHYWATLDRTMPRRTAILYDAGFLLTFAKMVVLPMMPDFIEIGFFRHPYRDQAMDWLLAILVPASFSD